MRASPIHTVGLPGAVNDVLGDLMERAGLDGLEGLGLCHEARRHLMLVGVSKSSVVSAAILDLASRLHVLLVKKEG